MATENRLASAKGLNGLDLHQELSLNCWEVFGSVSQEWNEALFWNLELLGRKQKVLVEFTRSTTRALHIELVSDLTTDKFLMALQRFVDRRELPHTVYTDDAHHLPCCKQRIDFSLE
ncbi:hypothetical protein AVEN_154323-1 [Araneus ventricosus]|uniref:Uncharacterized protein n=1 Tax=Araneus ventricosus TaxID=182803 RepID=A0A4Y2QR39_ARAVE|nr:hypothetical protein AVEN_154323-1 [Araneus ventricosus]